MPNNTPCELLSWAEIHRLCWRLAEQIKMSGYRPDIIIAIGRGGYIPARLLCDALNIMAMTGIKIEHYRSGSTQLPQAEIRYPLNIDVRNLQVLIVDDVNDSGDTLILAEQHIRDFQPREVRTAVIHDKTVTCFKTDYFAKRIIKWRWLIYPWAVNEDISAFLQQLSPPPRTLDEARHGLAQRFKIRISRQLLRHIDGAEHLG